MTPRYTRLEYGLFHHLDPKTQDADPVYFLLPSFIVDGIHPAAGSIGGPWPARQLVLRPGGRHPREEVKVPFHPDAHHTPFLAPPSRRPQTRGEMTAYLYAHPVLLGDEGKSGWVQHVRWDALDHILSAFCVILGCENEDQAKSLKRKLYARVSQRDGFHDMHRAYILNTIARFGERHQGWWISTTGVDGAFFVLRPPDTYQSYLWQTDYLDGWQKEDLAPIAELLFDFDTACMGAIWHTVDTINDQ